MQSQTIYVIRAVELAKTGRYTINEIRQMLGLPPVSHGHEFPKLPA